jgi:hypothetical protein
MGENVKMQDDLNLFKNFVCIQVQGVKRPLGKYPG